MNLNNSKMLEQKEAVIFDLDGTLVDSMWVWPAIDVIFYEEYDLVPPDDFNDQMEGMSFTEVAELFLRTFPSLPFTVEELKKKWTEMAFEKYTTEVPLKKGVLPFLKAAKQAGIKLGIATSNGRELVDATLKALGVESYFDSVRTACEVNKGKPAPDIYLFVAKELKVEPSKCLVFEDVPMGILAGKNAGMTTCAIDDFASSHQTAQKKLLADYFIHDYFEIENGII